MTTYTTGDGTVALTVSRHPHAKCCRYWVTYTKADPFCPVAVGDVIAKFASPGDAFEFASRIIDTIDRNQLHQKRRARDREATA